MKILRILRTWVTVKGLEVLLLSKEVIMPNSGSLGVVIGIRKELSQDKIWMVLDNLGQGMIIPIEQIASVANKVVLFGDLPLTSLVINGGTPSPNLSLQGR